MVCFSFKISCVPKWLELALKQIKDYHCIKLWALKKFLVRKENNFSLFIFFIVLCISWNYFLLGAHCWCSSICFQRLDKGPAVFLYKQQHQSIPRWHWFTKPHRLHAGICKLDYVYFFVKLTFKKYLLLFFTFHLFCFFKSNTNILACNTFEYMYLSLQSFCKHTAAVKSGFIDVWLSKTRWRVGVTFLEDLVCQMHKVKIFCCRSYHICLRNYSFSKLNLVLRWMLVQF